MNLYQLVLVEDALDGSLDTLLSETAHCAVETGALGHRPLANVDVVEKAEPDTAAVNGRYLLIDNSADELVLRLVGGDGVEVLGSLLLPFHHFLGLGFLGNFADCFLIDGLPALFGLVLWFCVVAARGGLVC